MKVQKSTVITVKDTLEGVEFDVKYDVEFNEFIIKVDNQEIVLKGEQMDKLSEILNKILASK